MTEKAQRKMPVKTRLLSLSGDWTDWQYTARMNPPLSVFFDITSGDLERIVNGIAHVIVAWNFVDENGEPLPEPTRDIIAQYVTSDLLTAIANSWTEEMAKLPPA